MKESYETSAKPTTLLNRMPSPLRVTERLLAAASKQASSETPPLHPGSRWISESDVEKRVQEAKDEADEQMNDLLVCLGQEEAKVSLLTDTLMSLGINVDEILQQLQ